MSVEIRGSDALRAVSQLTDTELTAQLSALVERDHRLTAELLVHIGEVDARRLYASFATSSLFGYCVTVLGFSEDVAYKRVAAARIAWRYPVVLEFVQTGKLQARRWALHVRGRDRPTVQRTPFSRARTQAAACTGRSAH